MEFVITLIIDLLKHKGTAEVIEKKIKYFMKRVPQKNPVGKKKLKINL